MTQQTLTEVRGDLVLAALCIGQFRAPCQIDSERLVVLAGEPLVQALRALGLELRAVQMSFTPAPLFAPEEVILEEIAASQMVAGQMAAAEGAAAEAVASQAAVARAGALRRQVHTHISRHHDEDAAEDDTTAASNA